MSLTEFLTATHGMPGSTEIVCLSPWGEFEPATLATIEDLVPGDPLIADFPPHAIVIASDHDRELNIHLTQ